MTARRFMAPRSATFVFTQTISADTTHYNLRSAAIAAGWDTVRPLIATITINSGVQVRASDTATPAFDTGSSFPAGSSLVLFNNGSIVGKGGDGGDGSGGGIDGKPGGPAFRAQAAIKVTNSGTMAGGGGGGGCAIHDNYGDQFQRQAAGGNGGSSNANWSSGGSGTWGGLFGQNANSGAWSSSYNTNTTTDGTSISGGYGGTWGVAGGSASDGNAFNGAAGAGGPSVVGNSNVTWLATGTRYGAVT